MFYLKLSPIFYAEYGAYADREYMNRHDDWSRVIESSHSLFCGVFALVAINQKFLTKKELSCCNECCNGNSSYEQYIIHG